MKSEMAVLRRRVEDLEDSLRTNNNGNKSQNCLSFGPLAPESYSFPSIPVANSHDTPSRLRAENSGLSRRLSSPGWGQERDREGRPLPPQQQHQHALESDNLNSGSPAPFESKRLSSTRLDPPRVQHQHNGLNMQSPPQGFREQNNKNHNNHNGNNASGKQIVYPPTPTSGHLQHPSSRNGGDGPLSRQNSSLPIVMISGESPRDHDSGSGRRSRVGSPRNSIVMLGLDGES
jgi:hypothetical protein